MKHRWSLPWFTLSLIRELRLYEVLEDPPICNRLLQYKVHKERQDSSRFDKGTPQTMKSLTELVYVAFNVSLILAGTVALM